MDQSYKTTEKQAQDIRNRFTHHPPFGTQVERYAKLRNQGRELASLICGKVPESRERDVALMRLQECIMWANAGIAINEKDVK